MSSSVARQIIAEAEIAMTMTNQADVDAALDRIRKLAKVVDQATADMTQSISYVDSIIHGNVTDVTYETMQKARFNRPTNWRRKYTLKDAKSDAAAAAMHVRKAWELLDPTLTTGGCDGQDQS